MKYLALVSFVLAVYLAQSYGNGTENHDDELENQLLVSVKQGRMRGSWMQSSSERQFAAFRSIPYARPPVGEQRFKDPVSGAAWDGMLDASREGPQCVQYDGRTKSIVGKEDCLVLNVYTHNVTTEKLMPVMVFIHGGSFSFGSGNGETDFYGPQLLLDKDVVLVTINYRLGPFGFLSTEDAEAPGNYGLLDQSLALKWVRENIQSFGGDSNSITIFGESVGGASVEYQILSPLSQGLFHRAISQSGSSICRRLLLDDVGEHTKSLASLLNCPTNSSSEIVQCLRSKSAEEIIDKRRKLKVWEAMEHYPLPFGPRIDVEREFPFLPAHPRSLIADKNFTSVPYLTGLNKNEGCLLVAPLLTRDGKGLKDLENDPMKYLPYLIGTQSLENKDEITKKVVELFDKDKPFGQQLQKLEEVISDTMMFKCFDESANLFRKFNENPTYYYYYAYRGSMSLTTIMGLPPAIDLGVCHADELFLMFANQLLPVPVTDGDKQISQLLIDLWTSFAINGSPQSDLAPKWLPMDKDERRYLSINVNNVFMSSEELPFDDRLPFWNEILEKEGKGSRNDELCESH